MTRMMILSRGYRHFTINLRVLVSDRSRHNSRLWLESSTQIWQTVVTETTAVVRPLLVMFSGSTIRPCHTTPRMTESNEQQSKVASFFDYEEYGTDTKTEVIAGITTFLTMSYIIVINPAILSAAISIDGYSDGEVFQMIAITTILAAVVGTAVMALYANRPFGLAPGMGLNAYFAFTVVITLGVPWQTALAAVFVEGLIFMAMSSVGARRYIIEFFPKPVKFAVGLVSGCSSSCWDSSR